MTAPRAGAAPLVDVHVNITLEGDQLIVRKFRGIAERADNISPEAWDELLDVFFAITGEAFDTEGGSTTEGAWPDLAETTIAERRRQGFPPGPILDRTGLLSGAVSGEDPEGMHVVKGPNFLSASVLVEYFKYHQSTQPRTRLPRRAMISFTQDDKHAMLRPIRLYITGHSPSAARERVGPTPGPSPRMRRP